MFSAVHLTEKTAFRYNQAVETQENIMVRTKKTLKAQIKQQHKALNDGLLVQAAKELTTIPAYAMRELTGQPHDRKPKCTLRKGWFE